MALFRRCRRCPYWFEGAGCGTRFTNERWKAIEPAGWDTPRDTHPHLCDDCKQRAITAHAKPSRPGTSVGTP
ncbi:hypothetical protein [Streptomyces cuspidosporus]|uniref:Uncharacterized protein n=1 Tax=Streptomyces cuspidosporus TaxID=66882 RepID=A0ABN3FB94_9ACTN